MNILITILSCFAIVFALVLIIALFIKKNYEVAREVVIDKPRQEVFNYIKYLKNQDNYSVWATMDDNMKKEFSGTDGTVGFKSAWNSENKKVGAGEQTISFIYENETVIFNLHFIKPFEGKAIATMTTADFNQHQTKVTWQFNSGMKYPMNFMLLFIKMDKMIGNDLSIGLVNLKKILERTATV